ncbi:MAG TPA: phosphoribosylformylglycinamidine synthase subunit PurL [Planctomycetes bacterium]|nr:phosphoribosylformylglycinamidine synthase subunit PurL [Planctomycetota bacterium]
MVLWEVDIYPATGQVDRRSAEIVSDVADLGLAAQVRVVAAHGYLLEGDLSEAEVQQLAAKLLADHVVEKTVVAQVGDAALNESPIGESSLVHVLPKPGVMDPVAMTALTGIQDSGAQATQVRTFSKYWLADVDSETVRVISDKILANDSIEQVIYGSLDLDRLEHGVAYEFELKTVPIRELTDDQLESLSSTGQLYLTLVEMQTIQQHFQDLDRDPTDIELESVAQTWSEHCSHKTLAGRIAYRDENGERQFDNMLKETIFGATVQIREELGDDDWCVSVFKDNAGIVTFNDEFNVVFKVETHNHPSALEPYGGANTGIGGVIRDPMGTGLGAKPICNTNVFCFANPDTALDDLPAGVLHPRRVMKGVVSGVRDYGNRMGIPTVNGALYFDDRYLGNPLVYAGNVGIIPCEMSFKEAHAGEWVVAIGGHTGRDGIHGATFSSAELTSDSESLSGGAVQIGNAITEKMVLDVLIEARDRGLYTCVTDCGAGGFASAVGEMGEEIGVEVYLDKCPLKYDGLNYTEIWISEAQERMVFSVPDENWQEFHDLCESEGVSANIIGKFQDTGRLVLKYEDHVVGDLTMDFLHNGRPPVVRDAFYEPPVVMDIDFEGTSASAADDLLSILGSLNVASKEWVIRQYDHEVQAGSVIKPLVGVANDGPGDAAVVRPVLDSWRALTISCGMNPRYGDLDTYHMAASGIDEAIRNSVAVGANPDRIAILDNFCWGYTDRPETLGSLVRAALACYDIAVDLQTPFISGKDSLNNEFSFFDDAGEKQTISIPATLLISALGQVDDARTCVTMDFKESGNVIYLVGTTACELGGSHWTLVRDMEGGQVPQVDTSLSRPIFRAVHQAISTGLVRACHDLSEGGLAVGLAEMAFAGGLGANVDLDNVETNGEFDGETELVTKLFSESNTRFVCEVKPENQEAFEAAMSGVVCKLLGTVDATEQLSISRGDVVAVDLPIAELKEAWQSPLRW